MNMRERMLALIQGRELDRVPFVQYDNVSAPNEEIWETVGEDNMGVTRWVRAYRLEHPNCRMATTEVVRDGKRRELTALITPVGRLVRERTYVEGTDDVWAVTGRYVRSLDDYRILKAYLEDVAVVEDLTDVRKAIHDLGNRGLPHVRLARTPYQQLWIEWADIEDLSLHLADGAEIVAEIADLLGAQLRRIAEVTLQAARKVDIPYVVIGDNLTTSLIGEARFRQYCLPSYQYVSDIMEEEGIPLYVHMDGDLKPLWEAIGESGVGGIDSLSPPPDNDTSVADVIAMWPDMRVLVNFPSSVHLASPEAIYAQACTLLEEGGHTGRLQIQISENTPPGVWKTSYPQIVRAIQDFGRP